MSATTLKAQVTQAIDSLDDTDLQNVVEYVEFLRFRARHNAYQVTDEIAALYASFAEEDRTLAEKDMAAYHSTLEQEDAA